MTTQDGRDIDAGCGESADYIVVDQSDDIRLMSLKEAVDHAKGCGPGYLIAKVMLRTRNVTTVEPLRARTDSTNGEG